MTSLILTTLLFSSPGPGEVIDPFSSDSSASTQPDSQPPSPDQVAPKRVDPFAPVAPRPAPQQGQPERSEILDPFAGAPAPQPPIRVEMKDPFRGATPRPRLDVPFVDPFAGLEAARRSVF